MYLKCKGGYNKDGAQWANGLFLIVFDDPFSKALRPELRAIVRTVKLKQLGHWMMGDVGIHNKNFTLSGAYGSDGLPFHLGRHFTGIIDRQANFAELTDDEKQAIWNTLLPIPPELQEAFWEGGGHNTSGSEGPAFRKWGLANLSALRKAGKP